MRWPRDVLAPLVLAVIASHAAMPGSASANDSKSKVSATAKGSDAPKPWCAPELSELSGHVCYFDGGAPAGGRKTLVIYLHGALSLQPGFFYLQQRAMALHAKKHGFTVLLPTSPSDGVGHVWPTSRTAQGAQEAGILAGIAKARAALEARVGHQFDETFVVGFSSGAYYASSLAVRDALDVDGYIILAGGSSWVKSDSAARARRAPIFVGVSAADRQTAGHSRAFAASLAATGWPFKVEERNAGHMVDWTFMAHGIGWLRERTRARSLASSSSVGATR